MFMGHVDSLSGEVGERLSDDAEVNSQSKCRRIREVLVTVWQMVEN